MLGAGPPQSPHPPISPLRGGVPQPSFGPMRYVFLAPLFLAACASPSLQFLQQEKPTSVETGAPDSNPVASPPVETLDPTPAPPPPPRARTVEQFDTTSAEDRAEALAAKPEPASERKLGKTIASLGSPTDPGIWIKTPLVSTLTPGRAEGPGGKSINVELRPSGTAAGSGSQISLAAMRLLGVPLTDLPELTLYALPPS